jgi:thioredoxin-like negative regulator of GroEL
MKSDDGTERALRDALAGRGAPTPCPGEEAMVAFHGGRLSEPENEAIREHLARCATCVALSADARRFVESMEEAGPHAMSLAQSRRWLAAAAAIAIAALAGIWLARTAPTSPVPPAQARVSVPARSWRELAVTPAEYRPAAEDELLYRSDETAQSAFATAMTAYARGDYTAAQGRLAAFLESHPGDTRASFYRGVSLLMLDNPEEALPLLSAASQSPARPAEARWYLALAQLKAGDVTAALRDLVAVAAAPGTHRAEAAKLVHEVRASIDAGR